MGKSMGKSKSMSVSISKSLRWNVFLVEGRRK
jgi:hypothetical protein